MKLVSVYELVFISVFVVACLRIVSKCLKYLQQKKSNIKIELQNYTEISICLEEDKFEV